MKPTGDNAPLTIPPALLAEIQAAADREHRPAGEVLKGIIEHGLDALRARAGVHARANEAEARYTPAQAAQRIRELRKGHFLPEGETIRSLIDSGRR